MKPTQLAFSILLFLAACQEKPVASEGKGIPPYVPPPAETSAVSTATAASTTTSVWSTVPAPPTPQPGAAAPVPQPSPTPPVQMPALTPPLAPPTETAGRISVANLQQVMASAPPVILDVRSPEQFKVEHIPGAINIPLESLPLRMSEIPKGRPVVAYCT